MDIFLFANVTEYVAIAFYLVAAVMLVVCWRKTQSTGFLWLVAGLVLWPAACEWLGHNMGHSLATKHAIRWFPIAFWNQFSVWEVFTFWESLKMLGAAAFIMVGTIVFLRRSADKKAIPA